MNKIVFWLYVSVAAKPSKKGMRRVCFCASINHQQTDPLRPCHPTKFCLPLKYIAQNFRAKLAEPYQLTSRSSYNPHIGAWRLSCTVRRSREAVSFIEFNP
jgi:hypothetical protein